MNKNRAGFLQKNLSGNATYFSFCPSPLPPNPPIDVSPELSELIIRAHRVLACLDEKAKNIPDMDLFISMYVRKEALLSSQIEGTQATLEDLFDPTVDTNINADVSEVVNYIQAVNYAVRRLETLPLCNRLLLEAHELLMSGVRGKEKNPGEFRRSQNWIGGSGSTLRNARYIPPNVDTMHEALSDLEKYMHKEDSLDPLIRAALIHYQFESIHPFLDGNGRIGRLLIVLYLLSEGVMHAPALYLSAYLKAHRIEYYDRMSEVRRSGNYEQWIKFFIRGIWLSGQEAVEKSEELLSLHQKHLSVLEKTQVSLRKKKTLRLLFDYLLSHPMAELSRTSQDTGVAYNTVSSAFKILQSTGILTCPHAQLRNKVYVYEDYLKILSEGTQIADDPQNDLREG